MEQMTLLQEKVVSELDRLFPRLVEMARTIYEHPELGFEEKEAAELLGAFLQGSGFHVEAGLGSLPTAFRAFQGAAERPSVAFLAEYDALPGLGHACGHNLIAVASAGAGAALAAALPEGAGRVFVMGTPAEEMHGGKIRMIQEGAFDGVEAALMFHPSVRNAAVKRTLAMTELKVSFHGKSSHAAAAPELGINALDAMVLTFAGINALRQQIPDDARIHGIITRGGDAPNIIPAFTEARIAVRSLEHGAMKALIERVRGCVAGAAQATGCSFEVEAVGPAYEGLLPNYTLAGLFRKHVEALGMVIDDHDETGYIGSSDIGNVSRVMPVIHPELTIGTREALPHTTGFCRAVQSEEAQRVMGIAAKALALTALSYLADPDTRAKVQAEFEKTSRGAKPASRS